MDELDEIQLYKQEIATLKTELQKYQVPNTGNPDIKENLELLQFWREGLYKQQEDLEKEKSQFKSNLYYAFQQEFDQKIADMEVNIKERENNVAQERERLNNWHAFELQKQRRFYIRTVVIFIQFVIMTIGIIWKSWNPLVQSWQKMIKHFSHFDWNVLISTIILVVILGFFGFPRTIFTNGKESFYWSVVLSVAPLLFFPSIECMLIAFFIWEKFFELAEFKRNLN